MNQVSEKSKPKVAVCFSGLPRTWEKVINVIKKTIIEPYDADVFLHSWYQDSPDEYKNLLDSYKPKNFILEKDKCITLTKNYPRNTPNFSTYNAFSMFKGIWTCNAIKCSHEAENNFKYDWVMRMRFDVPVYDIFDLKNMDNKFLYVPVKHSAHKWNQNQLNPRIICDTHAFSSSEIMDMYSGVYVNIDQFYSEGDKYNFDPNEHHFEATRINGEHLLAMQLIKCKLNSLVRYIPSYDIIRD